MQILLTSFPFPYDGAAICFCHLCNELLYEDRENIARVLESDGFILCPSCSVELKLMEPSMVADVQMRKGHIVEPQMKSEFAKWFMGFMSRKV